MIVRGFFISLQVPEQYEHDVLLKFRQSLHGLKKNSNFAPKSSFSRCRFIKASKLERSYQPNAITMCTVNMTFEIPDTKRIDIDALKQQMYSLFQVLISTPSVLKQDVNHSWTEEFRGKWQDDNMTAEEFVREIRANRSIRKTVDL